MCIASILTFDLGCWHCLGISSNNDLCIFALPLHMEKGVLDNTMSANIVSIIEWHSSPAFN